MSWSVGVWTLSGVVVGTVSTGVFGLWTASLADRRMNRAKATERLFDHKKKAYEAFEDALAYFQQIENQHYDDVDPDQIPKVRAVLSTRQSALRDVQIYGSAEAGEASMGLWVTWAARLQKPVPHSIEEDGMRRGLEDQSEGLLAKYRSAMRRDLGVTD